MKRSLKSVVLIIILILMIVCGYLGYNFFVNSKSSPKTIYTTIIDQLASNIKESTKEYTSLISKPTSVDYNLNLNVSANYQEYRDMARIINKIKMSGKSEIDYQNKYISNELNINYGNDRLIKGITSIIDNNMYLESSEIYNKIIKISESQLDNIWKIYDEKNINNIQEELISIIKNCLKDEYFSKETNNGITRYILDMTEKKINSYSADVNTAIQNNDKLLTALSEMTTISVEDYKKAFSESTNSTNYNEPFKVIVELEKKELKLISFEIEDNKLLLEKNSDKFDIKIFENNNTTTIGYLKYLDNYKELNIDYENMKLNYVVNGNNKKLDLNLEYEGIKFNISNNQENDVGKMIISYKDSDMNIIINLDYTLKELASIERKIITSSIDINDITQSDLEVIQNNIYNNEALNKFVQDVNSIVYSEDDYYFESY